MSDFGRTMSIQQHRELGQRLMVLSDRLLELGASEEAVQALREDGFEALSDWPNRVNLVGTTGKAPWTDATAVGWRSVLTQGDTTTHALLAPLVPLGLALYCHFHVYVNEMHSSSGDRSYRDRTPRGSMCMVWCWSVNCRRWYEQPSVEGIQDQLAMVSSGRIFWFAAKNNVHGDETLAQAREWFLAQLSLFGLEPKMDEFTLSPRDLVKMVDYTGSPFLFTARRL